MKVFLAFYSFLLFGSVVLTVGQRVPPGVHPQHYQGQPPQYGQHVPQQQPPQQAQYQQQQQQQHQQHQQVPVQQQQQQQQVYQQQQIPQQQQVPQQQQQPPQHQQQLKYHHGFNTGNMEHEKEHIAEHLEVPIDTSKMSEQELQFHYFKMHDADNNNKLDGCELIKSLIHWHEQGSKDKAGQIEEKIFKDEELITLIDPILSVDDINQDGYIDYPEFVRAQQKAAAKPSH